ncbi:hypothetical protein [Clostridium thermarum]|uniref:hypothetical protein n=1 Tax=Clostridium thermarum TaxID=1716543 RepID=UPI0013D01922|nr:hypothetical protein [Clostridium thermarum]
MKVNNYSALNKAIYDNFKTKQSRLIQSINKAVHKKSNSLSSNSISKDSLSIESGKLIFENQKKLALKGKNAEQFVAKNNVLDLRKGSYYKLQTSANTTAILTVGDKGNVYMPFSELGLDDNFTLPPSDYGEINKLTRLITCLAEDGSAFEVRTGGFGNAEIKDMLDKVGIKPGWFEVKSGSKSNKFYLVDNGLIYPQYQVEAERRAFNGLNWFNEGYTRDSVFTIEGKDYKLDENGHLNIPEGVGCLMDNTKIKR